MAKKAKTAKRGAKKAATRRTAKTRKTARRKTAARAAATRARTRKSKGKKRPAPEPSAAAKAAALVAGAAANAAIAIKQRLPWAKDENDPIVLLETDHRRFEDLLKRGEETTTRAVKARAELLKMLTAEITEHELLEEKLLYPALEPHAASRDIVLEGYEEHHVADVLLKELKGLSTRHPNWGAKFKVLKESLEHHIKEEESQMFRLARTVLSRDEQLALGARMQALRNSADA